VPELGAPFQVGVLVADLDAARDELSAALGVTWGDALDREVDGWTIRVCFSKQGPPYLELIEGPEGSPWASDGGSRIDHIGYWTADIHRSRDELAGAGLPTEVDGAAAGGIFTYHRGRASGLRVELVDSSARDAFYERWGLDDPDRFRGATT
jgi:hypothetical protein